MRPDTSVVLLTVPRTGTGFFSKLLRPHFTPIGMTDTGNVKRGLVVSHVSMDGLELLANARGNSLVVTTWREWGKVRNSFRRHGDSFELFQMHFTAWVALVLGFNPIVLTVEPEYEGVSREDRLASLGEKLGINLQTDWEPVN